MDFFEPYWQQIISIWKNDYNLPEWLFSVVSGTLVQIIFWWGTNLFMYLIYHFNLFPSMKIQPLDKWPDKELINDSLKKNFIATFLTNPLLIYGLWYLTFKDHIFDPLPSTFIFIRDIFIFWFFADGLFYWLHRLAHEPPFYWIHKHHHQWKVTIGIASIYAHPLEEIFVNGLSTFAGLFFITPHWITLLVFLAMRLEETVEEHSGYDLKFSPWYLIRTNRHHDFHHSHNIGSFGTFPFWDKICGTDISYDQFYSKEKVE